MLSLENVSLRAIKRDDYDALYQAINSPDLVAFNSVFEPIHEKNHLEWLNKTVNDKNRYFFIIEFNDSVVGSVQLFDVHHIHRNAEVSIRIFNKENLGKGIGTKALQILCDYAFETLGLVRVWLRVFESNIRAIKSYEKAGFLKEGVMLKAAFIKGEFLDIIVMGRVHEDIL